MDKYLDIIEREQNIVLIKKFIFIKKFNWEGSDSFIF